MIVPNVPEWPFILDCGSFVIQYVKEVVNILDIFVYYLCVEPF